MIRRIVLAWAASTVGMAGPAFGANMVSPSYGSSPYAWTGFYAGIDAGYDWNLRSPLSNSASFGNTAEFGSKGGSIGATIGFDYQFARRWVAGAAFDANLEDVEAVIEGPLGSVSAKIDRSIALRLRAGYLISPSTLIYATGGWVGMHSVVDYSVAPLFVSGDTTQGGFVVGGGIETAITHNLFVRAEYLHSEYASSAYFSTSAPARSSVNAARIGVTYKFGMPEWGAAYATEEAPLRASWTGFYGGIGAGYGASNTSIYLPPPSGYTETGAGAEGLSGVLSAGFDYQFGASIVAGIVADAAVNGATTDFFGGGIAFDQPRSLSLRGRLGYLLSGDTLIFASAGWSASRADFSAGGFEKSDTLNGFVFGGGIETMVTEHVALRAEYLHTLEAKMPISIAYELKQQNGVARTSLIYRF